MGGRRQARKRWWACPHTRMAEAEPGRQILITRYPPAPKDLTRGMHLCGDRPGNRQTEPRDSSRERRGEVEWRRVSGAMALGGEGRLPWRSAA